MLRDVDLNPHTIREAVEPHLQLVPAGPGRDLRVSPSTKIAFRMALHQAGRSGRQAINVNLLARQDRLPDVYGRDQEIQQVMEILCHRERVNSVMLVGEPGVGKTAIVEGLARRIEFEPKSVPVRLRDCQVVNLQMNAMVAGTMLRGMFEDRIQNVIKEIKERPHLILFAGAC